MSQQEAIRSIIDYLKPLEYEVYLLLDCSKHYKKRTSRSPREAIRSMLDNLKPLEYEVYLLLDCSKHYKNYMKGTKSHHLLQSYCRLIVKGPTSFHDGIVSKIALRLHHDSHMKIDFTLYFSWMQ